jgi:ParB-like chromosome segregation protein Spo0J
MMQYSTEYGAFKTAGTAGSTGLTDILVKSLSVHPLNEKLYGTLEPDPALVESIRQVGLLSPLVINSQKQILSGTRRWLAAKAIGLETLPKSTFRGTAAEEERLIIEANRQRVKTKGQIAREAAALLRIEKTLAAERESAGRNPSVDLHKGRATKIVGETLGLSERTAEKAAAVADAAENGNASAIDALAKLDRNEVSISAAYQRIAKPPKDKDAIAAHDAAAKTFTGRFKDAGIDGEVSRAKDSGKFHIVLRNLTAEQLEEIFRQQKEQAA